MSSEGTASWTFIGGGVIRRIFVVDRAGSIRISLTKDSMFAVNLSRGTWTVGWITASLAPRKIVKRRRGEVWEWVFMSWIMRAKERFRVSDVLLGSG